MHLATCSDKLIIPTGSNLRLCRTRSDHITHIPSNFSKEESNDESQTRPLNLPSFPMNLLKSVHHIRKT